MNMIKTQEHYDLMAQFERDTKYGPFAKEDKTMWAKGYLYQNAEINQKFLAYRMGYAYGKAAFQPPEPDRCDSCGRFPGSSMIVHADDKGSRCFCDQGCEIDYNRRAPV